jgi:cyclic pyranopterin phosphate synthase
MGICDPPLDVTPELEAVRCFPLASLTRVKVTDFSCELEIQDWFRKNTDSHLLTEGCFPHCADCPHFKAGRCYGGCLAWHKSPVDPAAEPGASTLAMAMHEALESGQPDLALGRYEEADFWSRTAVPSYLAAVAASQLSKWDKALRYAAYALSIAKNPDIKRVVREVMAGIPRDKIGKGPGSAPREASPEFISNDPNRNRI